MPWPNPDARFGRRVSANFSDTQARAILTRHERDVWDLGRIVCWPSCAVSIGIAG